MDRNTKNSENAAVEANDTITAKLLICYILFRINRSVNEQQLYEIILDSRTMSYFMFQEALHGLLGDNSVILSDNGTQLSLQEQGRLAVSEVRTCIPRALRERAAASSARYFMKQRLRDEFSVEYEQSGSGWNVICIFRDAVCKLMELRLYAPGREQAELIGANIKRNPTAFYSGILDLAIFNEDIEFSDDDV